MPPFSCMLRTVPNDPVAEKVCDADQGSHRDQSEGAAGPDAGLARPGGAGGGGADEPDPTPAGPCESDGRIPPGGPARPEWGRGEGKGTGRIRRPSESQGRA